MRIIGGYRHRDSNRFLMRRPRGEGSTWHRLEGLCELVLMARNLQFELDSEKLKCFEEKAMQSGQSEEQSY